MFIPFSHNTRMTQHRSDELDPASLKYRYRFDLSMVRPIFTDELAEMRYNFERFEFVNTQGKLTAFGSWEQGT
jgi:hypothetical protein